MGRFGALYQAHQSLTDHRTWWACSSIPSKAKYQRICRSELWCSLQGEAKSRFFTFFKNEIFNILSQHLTLKEIINHFKKYNKRVKIKYEKSKLVNQYSYRISNKKFTQQALWLNSKIYEDIKSTLKLFRNIDNEM